MGESIFGVRLGRTDLFDLVVDFADGRRQLLHAVLSFNVHEINLRLIEEKMIVQRRHAQALIKRDRHNWIDFIFEKNRVAHHQGPLVCAGKPSPGAKSHKRRHRPPIDYDSHVAARKGNLIDTFLGIEFAFEPCNLVDFCGIKRGRRATAQHNAKHSTGKNALHEKGTPDS